MKLTVIPIVISTLGTIPNGLVKGLEDLEIIEQKRPSNNKFDLNTETSQVHLRRPAVTQTSVRNHQLMLKGKILKSVKKYIKFELNTSSSEDR